MYWLTRLSVWFRRFFHSRGFGIQSPTDYWFVRYVVNEHWPYYRYAELGENDDRLTRKLGKLYFRIANWRQPSVIVSEGFRSYIKAGCEKATFRDDAIPMELVRLTMEGNYRDRLVDIYNKVDDRSVLIVEHIYQDMDFWREIVSNQRTGVTFDLYYCGIVMFDKKRNKQNYIINF